MRSISRKNAAHMFLTLVSLVRLMRPRQWIKNVFVLAAPVYGGQLFVEESAARTLLAVALFCGISGGIYILNDVNDVEQDRQHPVKRTRPLASGEVSPWLAAPVGIAVLAGSLWGSYLLSFGMFVVGLSYLVINIVYTAWWKHVVVLDILCVASGFVLRVVAGALAVDVVIRPWILACTLFLALLISLGKRRSEAILLGSNAGNHRRILGDYPLPFLDVLIIIVAAMTMMAYSLFTFESGRPMHLMMTIPFVLYGVFRYLYLIFVRNVTESPEVLFLRDKPLLLTATLWGVLSAFLFYYTHG